MMRTSIVASESACNVLAGALRSCLARSVQPYKGWQQFFLIQACMGARRMSCLTQKAMGCAARRLRAGDVPTNGCLVAAQWVTTRAK